MFAYSSIPCLDDSVCGAALAAFRIPLFSSHLRGRTMLLLPYDTARRCTKPPAAWTASERAFMRQTFPPGLAPKLLPTAGTCGAAAAQTCSALTTSPCCLLHAFNIEQNLFSTR